MLIHVTITERSNDYDKPSSVATNITADFEERTVDAYFVLFSKILAHAGFDQAEIMHAAASFVFNESTNPKLLEQIAVEHDLLLAESLYQSK